LPEIKKNLSLSPPVIEDAATDINGFVTLDNDKGVGFVIGTLSATDPDTDTTTNALTFTTDSADFEIVNGNELKR
jgi:hypothetical protein